MATSFLPHVVHALERAEGETAVTDACASDLPSRWRLTFSAPQRRALRRNSPRDLPGIVPSPARDGGSANGREHLPRAADPSRIQSWPVNFLSPERGVFRSVSVLRAAIQRFLDAWNEQAHPFAWIKTADQILTKANREPISASAH